jgi:nucleoporin POM152
VNESSLKCRFLTVVGTCRYRINGKPVKQEAKTSPFSLVQSQPGDFAIESIAHQNKRCTASVTDLRFAVHALPSAQVGHGKRVYQDIHEGIV